MNTRKALIAIACLGFCTVLIAQTGPRTIEQRVLDLEARVVKLEAEVANLRQQLAKSVPQQTVEPTAASKASGSEYLGKWEATSMDKYVCPLVISRNGASFLIKVEGEFGGTGAICEEYRGIFVLTSEGNLKGGPLESTMFFVDREKNQVAVSNYGSVKYLKKR